MSSHARVREAAAAVAARIAAAGKAAWTPEVGLVLGSGLGELADSVEEAVVVPYGGIPHFPISSVAGHAGRLVLGTLSGVSVAVMQGRVHRYEGYSFEEVVRPVRTLVLLGVRAVLLTNAAGGISDGLSPGTLMIITDHLNLMGGNPLLGPNEDALGPRFPDMTACYAPEVVAALREGAAEAGIRVAEGVYAALSGPCYETPAEVRMLRTLGADAVGMSTVPEAIAARHMGALVGGISCITNLAAGISPRPLSHDEVKETADRVKGEFQALLRAALPRIARAVR